MVCKLVKKLIRSKAFEKARLRDGCWQIIIDGAQLYSSREEPDVSLSIAIEVFYSQV